MSFVREAIEHTETPDPQIRTLRQVFDFARSCWKIAQLPPRGDPAQCTASDLRGGDRPSSGYRCVPVVRRRSQYSSPTKLGIRSSEHSQGDQPECQSAPPTIALEPPTKQRPVHRLRYHRRSITSRRCLFCFLGPRHDSLFMANSLAIATSANLDAARTT